MDFSDLLKPVLSFGVSMAGSFVTGKIQKDFTPLNNKPIPYRNATIFGGGAAAITQDPIDVGASMLGAFAASLVHTGIRKVRGK